MAAAETIVPAAQDDAKFKSTTAADEAVGAPAGAGPDAGLTAAASGSVSAPPPLSPRRQQQRQPVVLRVDVATKAQARFLTYSNIVLNLLFIVVSIALFSARSSGYFTGNELQRMYRAELIVGSVCLGVLLFLASWFVYRVRSVDRERCLWSVRQRYFTTNAAVLLGLQTAYCTLFVAAFADTLATPNCQFPWNTLAVTNFLQWTFFSALLFFLLARMQSMRLWRGHGALDMPPDQRLQVDRPLSDQLSSHKYIIATWLVLEAAAVVGMVGKLTKFKTPPSYAAGCEANLLSSGCSHSATSIISGVISFLIILGLVLTWVRMVRQALRDHAELPYNRYKQTHLYVRVQQRVITPVMTAVVLSLLFTTIIPSLSKNCNSSTDAQVGNLAVCLALTLAASIMAILYMPVSRALDSPLLQSFLQDFSWTAASMAADIQRRQQRLTDLEGDEEALPMSQVEKAEAAVADAVTFLPAKAMAGIAKVAGVLSTSEAARQLHDEPILCMETVLKLFYWSRLAYRNEPELDYQHVNANHALSLYGLHSVETVRDASTDTHAVLGWSNTTVVLAFRGTASIENVMTDLKAYKVVYPPPHHHHGRLVRAHAGFAKAWLHERFNERVLQRLQALDAGRPPGSPPLRFWITGHSLGGALAVLASLDISKAFPASKLTVYTFGAPRVGNSAFADEQAAAVPDTWAILNGKDPIPWIPKVGFKRSGKRVTVDLSGNLVLRPSYFELSVMERGTAAKDHLTLSYALSLVAVMKAQFSASKTSPGGPEGVAALSACVDLGAALALKNVDLESLKDPGRAAVSAEVPEKKARKHMGVGGSSFCGAESAGSGGCSWCGGRGGGGSTATAGEKEEGVEERRPPVRVAAATVAAGG